ncbi:quinoprotein relay system zinc metallohydrolase 2 (plasmid) [Azospirillum humicireducens]|uniref:Quinoprotein relay system zinc metallohydrolase 2 n=1 Tax=Azospirillum humicireducens TaxID=1226968 RepID=A0A2R4VX81_9PROT|nr:quinoprotein relay system zinc metallohydrolase 2 [Azospirillum humicireducens]AWB09013.1 quinoprotein relay system zinc metallohydrolase 2 [Azospirillum humicireducens]
MGVRLILAAMVSVATAAPAWAEPLAVTEIAPGIFVHQGVIAEPAPDNRGDTANIGFIVGGSGVAVIDTGGTPELGRRLRETIDARTDKLPVVVINTHMHPDHLFGNAAFDGVPVVGHANLRDALAARIEVYRRRLADELGAEAAAGIAPLRVDRPVREELLIDLGGRIIVLTAHPTAHTNNDLTVFDRQTGTLFAGDLLFLDHLPAVDGSAVGWLRVIDALERIPALRAVPGHGPAVVDWPGALDPLRRYLTTLVEGVRRVQKAGGSIQEAVAHVAEEERHRWLLFDVYNPRNVTATFAELEWE